MHGHKKEINLYAEHKWTVETRKHQRQRQSVVQETQITEEIENKKNENIKEIRARVQKWEISDT